MNTETCGICKHKGTLRTKKFIDDPCNGCISEEDTLQYLNWEPQEFVKDCAICKICLKKIDTKNQKTEVDSYHVCDVCAIKIGISYLENNKCK